MEMNALTSLHKHKESFIGLFDVHPLKYEQYLELAKESR